MAEGGWKLGPGAAHADALRGIPERIRFCDPVRDINAATAWATSAVSADFGRRTARVLHADWFASQIGLLPGGLLSLILPPWLGNGEAAFTEARRELSVELQVSLATAALKCFRQWSQMVELHTQRGNTTCPAPPWHHPSTLPATDTPTSASPEPLCSPRTPQETPPTRPTCVPISPLIHLTPCK